MLTSFALIFLTGLLLGTIFNKLKLPGLLGMLLAGIIIGPYTLDLIDDTVLIIASDLRNLALVIILTRAGLAMDLESLKKVGRPAILMCFIPATFEISAVAFLAPKLFGITLVEALLLGSVLAAVSPAVIVPRMLKLIEEKRGTNKSIPQLIMAGASVDDVFVIVLFTSFAALAEGGDVSFSTIGQVPIAIVIGIILGIVIGMILVAFFRNVHMRDTVKVLILLGISFLMLDLEHMLEGTIPVSALIAIMSMGATILKAYPVLAVRLSAKFSKLWVAAEIILFVLVGAAVDLRYAVGAGVSALILLCFSIVFRMLGVSGCLVGTKLNKKERLFCMIAYTPKATVQAAIGAVPLTMGLACGPLVLTVAVLSIIITAPIGAFAVDRTYRKFLAEDTAS